MREILDVSNIVYGGYYGSPDYRVGGFPCGGIRKLLGIINADFRQSDFILCFDGGDTIKKELLPRYKAGRVPNYAVMAQLDLLKEIFLDCEIPYYWDNKHEADDFICSSVHFLTQVRDPDDIVIISDDRDLSCCISDSCRVKAATSLGTNIDRASFEERVVKGTFVPYNTILVHKMIFGDHSDNYPGLHIPGLVFDTFANFVVENVMPFIESGQFPVTAFMDIQVMNALIDMLPDTYTAEAREQLKEQAKIVFPHLLDVTANGMEAFLQDVQTAGEPLYRVERRHIKTFGMGSFNQKKFDLYCSVFNLNRCRPERYGANFVELAESFKKDLKLRAKDLASGAMAVEHYQSRKTVHPSSNVSSGAVQSMELPL